MKCLTLWRPWPWCIFHAPRNPKRIENRSWKPPERLLDRRIVLHAGKTFDADSAADICSLFAMHPDGDAPPHWRDEGLIGVVTIQGVAGSIFEVSRFGAEQKVWWSGPYAWLLKDVRAFREPIPCKGAQGLWTLPGWAEARVLEALR